MEEAFQTLAEFERAYPDHEQLPGLRARALFLSGAVDEATAWARVVETAHTAALVGNVEWARAHIETRLAAGLPEDVMLNWTILAHLIELSVLTSAIQPRDMITDEHVAGWRLANAHARIQSGDTVGVRAVGEALPLHIFQRALLSERLGDTDRTIELYEKILQPGYTGWGNGPQRIRALMRLGPLYEEAGDTLRAIEAYRSFSPRWASGDGQGRAVAERFAARALELEAKIVAGSQ